jgi:vesicle coat complex subunit
MKLKSKLIAAPLATAVVALAAGMGYGAWAHVQSQTERQETSQNLQQFKSLGESKAQIAIVHAGAYRVMAILNSLDDAQVKAFATSANQQVQALSASVDAMAQQAIADSAERKRLDDLGAQLTTYRKQVAKAMEMSSIDANMGVAALKAADQGFAQIGRTISETISDAEAAAQQRQAEATKRSLRNAGLFGLLATLVDHATSLG